MGENKMLSVVFSYLIPLAVKILVTYGLPALELRFPSLIPIVDAILHVLKGNDPGEELKAASDHFNGLVSLRK